MPQSLAEAAYLFDQAAWLIRLRWLAIVGTSAVVGAAWMAGILTTPWPFAITLLMAAYNLGFLTVLRGMRSGETTRRLRSFVFAQLALDIAFLGAMLHWSDAVENPFVTFYAFAMLIGGMLLTRRQALWLAALASLMHAGIVIAEHRGLLAHHPLQLMGATDAKAIDEQVESAWFIAGHLLAVVVLMFGVVLFVRAVVERRLRAEAREHEHERVALSRERLAHVGEISAGVAHAVRNPLHGLMNCVELLQAKVGSDHEFAETLDMMGDALERIESVTRRLLVLMRDSPINPVATDVDALVTDSLKFMSARADSRQVRVVAELGGVGLAEVDADRLSEALINVLDNAVDASNGGGVVVVRTAMEQASAVRIEVRDEGAGMTAEQLQKVFHPFFTTKPVGKGTGLGLAITKRIVEEHGGTILVRSEPHRGTAVELSVARTFQRAEARAP